MCPVWTRKPWHAGRDSNPRPSGSKSDPTLSENGDLARRPCRERHRAASLTALGRWAALCGPLLLHAIHVSERTHLRDPASLVNDRPYRPNGPNRSEFKALTSDGWGTRSSELLQRVPWVNVFRPRSDNPCRLGGRKGDEKSSMIPGRRILRTDRRQGAAYSGTWDGPGSVGGPIRPLHLGARSRSSRVCAGNRPYRPKRPNRNEFKALMSDCRLDGWDG
jgi:hypothetical protein